MSILVVVTILSVVQPSCAVWDRSVPQHGGSPPPPRPLIIAHRGNSGVYPEHTEMAYRSAIDVGADIIECDMAVTLDLQLVCSHESWLSGSTNIADVYPESRKNTYFVVDQLRNITNYFSVDFTLEELKLVKRKQKSSYRDPNYDFIDPVFSLEELIHIIQNESRPIGMHLETKDPNWVNSLDIIKDANTTFEDIILELLERYGYNDKDDLCFIQSFSEVSLRYLRPRTQLNLMQLMVVGTSNESLQEIAEYADVIGPNALLIVFTLDDVILERTDLVERAHALNLPVHTWTLRNEDRNLPWDYGQDPYNQYHDFVTMGVDGIFTDHPATAYAFMEMFYGCETSP